MSVKQANSWEDEVAVLRNACFLLSLHLVTFFSFVQLVFIKIFDFAFIKNNNKDKKRRLSEQCAVTDTRT